VAESSYEFYLGLAALQTDYDGRNGARWKYQPYGSAKPPGGRSP